jgi:hypothetical protein
MIGGYMYDKDIARLAAGYQETRDIIMGLLQGFRMILNMYVPLNIPRR